MPVPPIGLVPAAGAGVRLRPFRYPKELLPVALEPAEDGVRPVLAVEFALRALARAGVRRTLVVVSDPKLDLVRLLGTGEGLGLDVAYVHQGEPLGLAHALARCVPWVGDAPCCLVLPDTAFAPEDAVARVVERLRDGADLVLGVFPTDRPEQLGPVDHDGDVVRRVLDKPERTDLRNTWGVAAWGPAFTRVLAAFAEGRPDRPVGEAFEEAVRAGLAVRAVPFPDGRYHDLGTTRGLAELLVPR